MSGQQAGSTSVDVGMTAVDRGVVIKHWLELEAAKQRVELAVPDVAGLSERHAQQKLLDQKPGAARVFHRYPETDWYRLQLRPAELERLRYIGGPDGTLWGALADDRRLLAGARRVLRGDSERIAAETGIDIEHILDVRDRYDGTNRPPAPVIVTRRGHASARILDGNHRLTAAAIAYLERGELPVVGAYLGIKPNELLKPAVERAIGAIASFCFDRRF